MCLLGMFDWRSLTGAVFLTKPVWLGKCFHFCTLSSVQLLATVKPNHILYFWVTRQGNAVWARYCDSSQRDKKLRSWVSPCHGQEVVHAEPQKITMDLPLPFPTFVIDAQTSPEGCPCRRSPSSWPIPGRWWGGVDSCYYGYDHHRIQFQAQIKRTHFFNRDVLSQ